MDKPRAKVWEKEERREGEAVGADGTRRNDIAISLYLLVANSSAERNQLSGYQAGRPTAKTAGAQAVSLKLNPDTVKCPKATGTIPPKIS